MAVTKSIIIEGTSPNNWHEAVTNAVAQASETIRNITRVDILHSSCDVKDNKIANYRVKVELAFLVERVSG